MDYHLNYQPTRMQSSHSNEDFPELCIVGSSSILYQDEMKYLEFEQGLHLIPWMGNTSLLVDRYDARGFLDNQSKFGLKSNLKFRPSQEEIELEQRCDEERYLELNMELSEMEIGTEEEEKRNSRIFAQIPFNYETEKRTGINYENPSNEKRQTTVDKPLNEITDFTPYIPKPELQIPVTMTTPGTERMHNIIVKTARHVAEKGNQLEIVIKIKQQYNSSFDFLSFDHFLHPYYKHIKNLVLSGFKPLFETQFDDKNSTEEYPPAHTKPPPVYPGHIPPHDVSALNIPQLISGNQELNLIPSGTNLNEQTAVISSSSEETELHPILRTGASSKFTPIPKLKAKRRQKAKIFLEKIKGECKPETADFTRETNQIGGNEVYYQGYDGYIHITPPPPDMQQLIDKVAFQVVSCTNENIEKQLKEGTNSIYDFLYPSNQYYEYYRIKKRQFKDSIKPIQKKDERVDSNKKLISFSIQSSIGNMELEQKVYLGGNSSSSEDESQNQKSQTLSKKVGVKMELEENRCDKVHNIRRKRVSEFMQKLRDKKSKQQTNKQSDIYEPEYPTEVVEKKIYQKAAIKYPINNDQERKSEEKHESDWVTKSKNK